MKPLNDYPQYSITRDGRLFRTGTRKELKGRLDQGYREFHLRSRGRERFANAHALVLETYVGPRPDGFVCRHLNGIRTDNRVENLQWGSQKDNCGDTALHGNLKGGE